MNFHSIFLETYAVTKHIRKNHNEPNLIFLFRLVYFLQKKILTFVGWCNRLFTTLKHRKMIQIVKNAISSAIDTKTCFANYKKSIKQMHQNFFSGCKISGKIVRFSSRSKNTFEEKQKVRHSL